MEDPNPIVRLKALDCFRKTMAAEPVPGVQVNNNLSVLPTHVPTWDFESKVAEIRRIQIAAHEGQVLDVHPRDVFYERRKG